MARKESAKSVQGARKKIRAKGGAAGASDPAEALLAAAERLRKTVNRLRFGEVAAIYNPLDYAFEGYAAYVRRFARTSKRAVFLGMNPGPYGMVQTGAPFGEVAAVRDWMGIEAVIQSPEHEHPKRPVQGFACTRSEVSGRRLWGFFAERFGPAEAFFADHFVANYCPLVFMKASGENLTPDKLPAEESAPLFAACDRHLRELADALQPKFVIGIGKFAEGRARRVLQENESKAAGSPPLKIAGMLHPSPASPAANRDFAGTALRQLQECGLWE